MPTQIMDEDQNIVKVSSIGGINTNDAPTTQRIAYNANNLTEYIGEAEPGTATSEAKWRIKKLVYSGTNVTQILWAGGNAKFDKVWDNHTSYSYS